MKSLTLSGQLSETDCLTYKLYPNTEVNKGKWQMCVTSISCTQLNSDAVTGQMALLSCNYVKDLKFSDNYTIDCFYPTLATVLLDTPATKKHKIEYLPENWFDINCYSDELRLFFLDPITKAILRSRYFVIVHILLRQIN